MDTQAAINDPSNFGFAWSVEDVNRTEDGQGPKIIVGRAPIAVVEDLDKFEAAFPGRIKAALDGSSIRVLCQGVTRRLLIRKPTTKLDDLKVAVLNALSGIVVRTARELTPDELIAKVATMSAEDKQRLLDSLTQ